MDIETDTEVGEAFDVQSTTGKAAKKQAEK
jgi:hypothetical protein